LKKAESMTVVVVVVVEHDLASHRDSGVVEQQGASGHP